MTLFSAFARFISRWELLWLLLLAPFLFFPEEGRGIAIAALPLLWAIRWGATRHMIPRTPLDGALLLLLLMVAVSLWATFDPAFSMPKVTGVLLGVGFYYALVARAGSRRGLLLALALFIAASCAMAAISLFTTNWTAKFPGVAQALAFLPSYVLALPGSPPEGFNPNGVAGALLFAFPLLLVLAWPYRNPTLALIGGWPRWIVYLLVLLLFGLVAGTLGVTQSRGGYLGALVGLAALLFLPRRRLFLLAVAAALVRRGAPPPSGHRPP